MNDRWIIAGRVEDLGPEDVMRFDANGRTYAIYRSAHDRYFATDGLCTHGRVHLAGGFVMGSLIECPKHNGRFDYTTGKAKGAPVCVDLAVYPVRTEGDQILIQLPP